MVLMNPMRERRGAVMVLFLMCIVSLIALLALSIDLGMLAVARTQCQDAADAAAMAGARTLNGSSGNNTGSVPTNAQSAAAANTILGKTVTGSQLTTTLGRYAYVSGNQRFEGQFPGPATENWSLVQATLSVPISSQMAFSKIFNFTPANIQATATAVHRPRDVVLVLDYSGSMRYASLLGDPPFSSAQTSNNPDTLIPQFGHYSATSTAAMTATSFTSPYDEANITTTTSDGRPPICADFYQDSSGTPAWTAASAGYATAPGGSNYLKINKNAGATYCTSCKDLLGLGSVTTSTRDATFESSGYKAYGMSAINAAYTQGPGYYGKTFFIWPPDPKNDWRKLYFQYPGSATGIDDNSRLWDASGNWLAPSASTYQINYAAILAWLKTAPAPFPTVLQSGRIKYYTTIPSSINTASWPPANLDERFWKDYIDYSLGLMQTGASSWTLINGGSVAYTGYGTDYAWGTVQVTSKASLTGGTKPYMNYADNPLRPRLRFWFGPLTMVDFLDNFTLTYGLSPNAARYTWWPGTCHEAPLYGCKLGIQAALNDIQNNHPNDLVSMIMFACPDASANDVGRFNRPRVGLSRNYTNMQESLWYPPSTVGNSSATITPYDTDNMEAPRAYGETCYSMPLMLAYNQFSANTSLSTYNPGATAGDAGGSGRKGAQKIIIFETDGAPNTTASATFTNSGSYNSYYNVRYNSTTPASSEFPTAVTSYADNDPTVTTQLYAVCNQLCALDTASSPGYTTTTKKVQIHCIGFGPQFSPSSSNAATNTATLNQMQTISGVTDNMPGYKIIYGNQASITADLQQAIRQILQNGVQVSLIQ